MNAEGNIMLCGDIVFKETKDISPVSLQELFRNEQWNDFFDLDEVELHLETALHIVSAWHENQLVGYARLEGNRLSVEITDVLVKTGYQGRGIGTELVSRLVTKIREVDPYFIQVTPISDREVHLYGKFGFTEITYYRRMELISEKLNRKIKAVRGQKKGKSFNP